jgi:hypothetical protein
MGKAGGGGKEAIEIKARLFLHYFLILRKQVIILGFQRGKKIKVSVALIRLRNLFYSHTSIFVTGIETIS